MRFLVALLPRARRDWGRALLAESEHADKSLLWILGGIRLVSWSWFDWMIGGNLMKTVVATLSTINVAMGVFLIGLFVFTGSQVPVVLMLAIGLIVQGGYTLWYMTSAQKQPWATRMLLVGETVALLVGGLGFITATVNNMLRPPPGADAEYGPMVVGAVIAAQAATTLYQYAVRREATGPRLRFSR